MNLSANSVYKVHGPESTFACKCDVHGIFWYSMLVEKISHENAPCSLVDGADLRTFFATPCKHPHILVLGWE